MHAWKTCIFFRRKPFSLSFQEINIWYYTYSDSPSFALSPPMRIASFLSKEKKLLWRTIEWPRENLSRSIEILFPIRGLTGLLRFVEHRLLYLLMSSDFVASYIRDKETKKTCFGRFWPSISLSLIEDFIRATVPTVLKQQSTSMSMQGEKILLTTPSWKRSWVIIMRLKYPYSTESCIRLSSIPPHDVGRLLKFSFMETKKSPQVHSSLSEAWS